MSSAISTNFIDWKRECWTREAAERFDMPWLVNRRVPLAERFAVAERLLQET